MNAMEQVESAIRMASGSNAVLTIAFDKNGVCQHSRIDYWPPQNEGPGLTGRILQHVSHIIQQAGNGEIQ